RAFSIYMELAQNILYYSPEKIKLYQHEESVGAVLLLEKDKHYFFSCANLIENDKLEDIVGHCEMINSLNRKALRDYKRAQRKAPAKKYSKGAGIGLIQVSITARNPILVEFKKIDKFYSLFALTTLISQENQPEAYPSDG
ncbi:MAG: SiaB family protein kinase, partial [Bacteroidota bacterium]